MALGDPLSSLEMLNSKGIHDTECCMVFWRRFAVSVGFNQSEQPWTAKERGGLDVHVHISHDTLLTPISRSIYHDMMMSHTPIPSGT